MPDAPAAAPSSQTARAPAKPAAGAGGAPGSQLLSELKVSGHLMTLESGLYCIVQTPAKGAEPGSGLPGVRLSLPPGSASRPDALSIAGFRADGWLVAAGDAALVRVASGPAQLLVTIYQSPSPQDGGAPNIQVMRLLEGPAAGAAEGAGRGVGPAEAMRTAPEPVMRAVAAGRAPAVMEMVAHIQERGDIGAMLGDWLGERGSKRWIEGFGLSPTRLIAPRDIEYQGVLGQGWLSPWVEGGQFCGSRAMALPLLGLRVRLRGEAASTYDVAYSASFIDGSTVGPSVNGEACEADSLAALEAFQIVIRPRALHDEPAAAPASFRAAAAKPARSRAKAAPAIPEPPPPPPARGAAKPSGKGGRTAAGRKR